MKDWRDIKNGLKIPTVSYCDQPYIVKTDDNAWLCCVTTGSGHEGDAGQHVSTMRSTDYGASWSLPVAVENPIDVENSYATMLKVPSGRIYIFYNHNTDDVRKVDRHDGDGSFSRVDSLGYFVFKYSDDHGKSWSKQRYKIPVRLFQCDLDNIYNGKICFFWNVGKPFINNNAAFVSLHKVGQMGTGFFQKSEGVLLKSTNILTESAPENITWETLPDGDVGLKTPLGGGPIAEEQSYSVLSDGSFYAVYRCVDGYPVEAYSRDGGHTWRAPQYMRYADGRLVKNPRAATFAWKCNNGKYLFWFHNHGGHFTRDIWGAESATNGLVKNGSSPYDDRNPVWLCGGVEIDSPEGKILTWSQPELVLYTDDPFIRMSYPDLIEENGNYYLSETQKATARVHQIPTEFIHKIWAGLENPTIQQDLSSNLIINVKNAKLIEPMKLPSFFSRNEQDPSYCGKSTNRGFAIELLITTEQLGVSLIDGMRNDSRGIGINSTAEGAIELLMNDGQNSQVITSEPCLKVNNTYHIVINIDGGPKIVSFIVNGKFCDGSEYQQFGWSRFSPYLQHINWADIWQLNSIEQLKVYNRILMSAEAIISYNQHSQLTSPLAASCIT